MARSQLSSCKWQRASRACRISTSPPNELFSIVYNFISGAFSRKKIQALPKPPSPLVSPLCSGSTNPSEYSRDPAAVLRSCTKMGLGSFDAFVLGVRLRPKGCCAPQKGAVLPKKKVLCFPGRFHSHDSSKPWMKPSRLGAAGFRGARCALLPAVPPVRSSGTCPGAGDRTRSFPQAHPKVGGLGTSDGTSEGHGTAPL